MKEVSEIPDIILAIDIFNPVGGLERQLLSVALNLKTKANFKVFLSYKFESNNQYVHQLIQAGIPVDAPGWITGELLDQSLFRYALSMVMSPVWFWQAIWDSGRDLNAGLASKMISRRLEYLLKLRKRLKRWSVARRLNKYFTKNRRFAPQLLHIFRGAEVLEMEMANDLPVVYTEGSIPGQADWWAEIVPQLHKIDHIIAVSEATALACKEEFGFDKKITKIFSMIDPPQANPEKKRTNTDVITIGSAGRFSVEKNQKLYIDAFAILVDKNSVPVRAFLAGTGPLKDELYKRILELDLQDKFHIIPAFTSETIAQFMNSIDIFVLSSRFEGTPSSIAEAMSFNLPIVATDVGGVKEIVEDQVTGLLVSDNDPVAFANALQGIIENTDLRYQMGKAGRDLFDKSFSSKVLAPQVLDVYNSCLEDRSNTV